MKIISSTGIMQSNYNKGRLTRRGKKKEPIIHKLRQISNHEVNQNYKRSLHPGSLEFIRSGHKYIQLEIKYTEKNQ